MQREKKQYRQLASPKRLHSKYIALIELQSCTKTFALFVSFWVPSPSNQTKKLIIKSQTIDKDTDTDIYISIVET